ncbi:MAG: hypothetical protein IT189_11080 [Microbacteriaceae bacterium]|nr:hypothetical protein [Microbacteriaceae bacterium]
MTPHVGIVIVDKGAGLVTVEHGDTLICSGIERLPFDLAAVARRVREVEDADSHYVIDSDGLGGALWATLERASGHWELYEGRGQERQALVDRLLVAVEQDRFRFAANLAEQDAMTKALVGYRRQVRDDGLIGSELVVALLLALIPPFTSIYESRGLVTV